MSKSTKIGLSKWIFYVKNHRKLSIFSMKKKGILAHFLKKWFFGNFNFKTPLLIKLCLIFDKVQLHRFAKKNALFSVCQYHMWHLILYILKLYSTTEVILIHTSNFFTEILRIVGKSCLLNKYSRHLNKRHCLRINFVIFPPFFKHSLGEEHMFMYRISQGHLNGVLHSFCLTGGPRSPVRIMAQV